MRHIADLKLHVEILPFVNLSLHLNEVPFMQLSVVENTGDVLQAWNISKISSRLDAHLESIISDMQLKRVASIEEELL